MKKTFLLFIVFGCLMSGLMAQNEQISTVIIDENYDDEADWDKEYRSSAQPNERGTMYDFQRQRGFPIGKRVGCTCMDGEIKVNSGKGACSGHGGVRYWHFEQADGTIIKHPTDRHVEHPEQLSEQERENLAAYAVAPKKEKPFSLPSGAATFGIVAIVCVSCAFMFDRYLTYLKENNQSSNPKDKNDDFV